MKDFKIPVITYILAVQGGMVWFLSGMEGRVKTLEGKRLGDVDLIVKENRRYIREVIHPSYNISDSWNNPHYNNWLKARWLGRRKTKMKVSVVGAWNSGTILYC